MLYYDGNNWEYDGNLDKGWKEERPHDHCANCVLLQERINSSCNKEFRCAIDYQDKCEMAIRPHDNSYAYKCRECFHCRRQQGEQRGQCLKAGRGGQCSPDSGPCEASAIRRLMEEKFPQEPWKPLDTEKMEETEKVENLFGKYPIKPEWLALQEQLEEIYNARKKLWESIGATEFMLISESPTLEPEIADSLKGIRAIIEKNFGSVALNRDFRRMFANPKKWRLNFAPGAIISAAQRDNSIGSACACLGADKEYEGTAGQVAFDPCLAVLEPINPISQKKLNGFAFVVIDETGIHGYGDCYDGSDVNTERAMNLAYTLAITINDVKNPNAEKHNAVIDDLQWLFIKTADQRIERNLLEARTGSREDLIINNYYKERDSKGCEPDTKWYPIRGINNAYEDRIKKGAFYSTGYTQEELYEHRIYDEDDINGFLDEADIVRGYVECPHCGGEFRAGQGISGYEYGIGDDEYCDEGCIQSEMRNQCDEELNGVCLIDGSLYTMPAY